MTRRKKIDIINYKIYKIASLDPTITEIYIGSTADLKQRKALHKSSCNNENSDAYNTKVYHYIRDNGGWGNFKVYVLEEIKCNEYQAELREEYYRKELNATLNMKMCRYGGTEQEYKKEYRMNNKEQIREQTKKYYEKNQEKILDKAKERAFMLLIEILKALGIDYYNPKFFINKGLDTNSASNILDKYKALKLQTQYDIDLTDYMRLNKVIKILLKRCGIRNVSRRRRQIRQDKKLIDNGYEYDIKDEQRDMWDILIESYEMGH